MIYCLEGRDKSSPYAVDIVATSSAWAGLEEEAPVDEAEAVRTFSGEPPGYVTTLRR